MKPKNAKKFIALLAGVMPLTTSLAIEFANNDQSIQTGGSISKDLDGIYDGNLFGGFFVYNGALTLSNGTLTNFSTKGGDGSGGGAGLGGAIFVNAGATVTLNNVNLSNNAAVGGNALALDSNGRVGGSLNNRFNSNGAEATGKQGSDASDGTSWLNNQNGLNGYNGLDGANAGAGSLTIGGVGGRGGNGANGSGSSAATLLAAANNAVNLIKAVHGPTETAEFTAIAAAATAAAAGSAPIDPASAAAWTILATQFTALATQSGTRSPLEIARAVADTTALIALTVTSVTEGVAGIGGAGGTGGNGGLSDFGNGGNTGGAGGNGGNALSTAGAKAIGGSGGTGGQGGFGGFGAGGGQGGNGGNGGTHGPAAVSVDMDGSAGAGGTSSWYGGNGGSGLGRGLLNQGGDGGSGFGGAIFVRSGGTLTIRGNATFEDNYTQAGSGYGGDDTTAPGEAGYSAGADLFLMKGANVYLDPGAGKVISFNGNPHGFSISDDSSASLFNSPIADGQGANVSIMSGLVDFNDDNNYSGHTIIEGGTLEAIDGQGIYYNSHIEISGGILQTTGLFTRYVGSQSNKISWTGSGGFSAMSPEGLTVKLGNGTPARWNTSGFVPTGSALIFGSEYDAGKVLFTNSVDLNGANRTILVTKNGNNDPTLTGVFSNGGLNIGDSDHVGTLNLTANSTYTGETNLRNGVLNLTGSLASEKVWIASGSTFNNINTGIDNSGLSSNADVSNDGILNLSNDDTVATYTSTGTLNGPGKLWATEYKLNNGSVINTPLGTGSLTTSGLVELNATSDASTVNVTPGSTLNLNQAEVLNDNAAVTVNGTLNLLAGNETIDTLAGTGTINSNAYQLFLRDSSFTGTLNADKTNVIISPGGSVSLGNGNTQTNDLTIPTGSSLTMGTGGLTTGVMTINGTYTVPDSSLLTYDILKGIGQIIASSFTNRVGFTTMGLLNFSGNYINLGKLAPGNSPGIVTIAGNFTNVGDLEMEVASAAPAGVGFDQVKVGGSVTISPGSRLILQKYGSDNIKVGKAYQLISNSTGNSIVTNGTFSQILFDSDGTAGAGASTDSAAYIYNLQTSQTIFTGLNPQSSTYADLGRNRNERAAADAIFTKAQVATRQLTTSDPLTGTFAWKIVDEVGTAGTDLARFVPDYYGAMADFAFVGGDETLRQIAAVDTRVSGVNADYSHQEFETADNANANRNDYFVSGAIAVNEKFGFAASLNAFEGDITSTFGKADADGISVAIGAKYVVNGKYVVHGTLGHSTTDYNLTRATLMGTAEGITDTNAFMSEVGVTYDEPIANNLTAKPYANLTWKSANTDGFTETGAIDRLINNGSDATRLTADLGVKVDWKASLVNKPITTQAFMGLKQIISDSSDTVDLTLVNVTDVNYAMDYADDASTLLKMGVNFNMQVLDGQSAYTGYETDLGAETTHKFNLGYRISF